MGIKAETSFSLKDQLFNAESVGELAGRLAGVLPRFRRAAFEREVLDRFADLELKERIAWIVTVLESYLPATFTEARRALHDALPEPLDPTRTDDDFGKFIWVVPGEYVAKHGCKTEFLGESLEFLREATKRFSSEGAIRPFLKHFPNETLAFVNKCTADTNYHVRRLASEGIRPFLPWAMRAHVPVDAIIDVLDKLYADQTRYVTRSVANTLNDISRIDPARIIETLERWRREGQQQDQELGWMIRHSLRTLLKQDYPAALELLGYTTEPNFRLSKQDISKTVAVGDNFEWRATLTSLADQRLKVTLKIHYLKANGSLSAKVFAVRNGDFRKGESFEIAKRQPFRPVTTRTLYPGIHYAELIVNGKSRKKRAFNLIE